MHDVTRRFTCERGASGPPDAPPIALYDDLRRLAARCMRYEPDGHTLQATALAHEAYLRLARSGAWRLEDRDRVLAAAVVTMRRLLVDWARRRKVRRRRRSELFTDEGPCSAVIASDTDSDSLDLESLDEALRELGSFDERSALVVQLRFFGGLSLPAVARVLEISLRTAESDWALARAWLRTRLEVHP